MFFKHVTSVVCTQVGPSLIQTAYFDQNVSVQIQWYSWFSSRPTIIILVSKKAPSIVSPYLKHGIDLTMHSRNAWHIGGMWDRMLGRIGSPRKRTTLAFSLVYPIIISLGNVRFFTSVDGKDFRNCFSKYWKPVERSQGLLVSQYSWSEAKFWGLI